MKEKAIQYYKEGYSCSESVLKSAIDENLIPEHLLPVATAFSGGISSGCLCGAVAASEIIIGALNGRCNLEQSPDEAKALAKEFLTLFKEKRKAVCCRILSAKYDFHSQERKQNCMSIVSDCTKILEKLLQHEKTEAFEHNK